MTYIRSINIKCLFRKCLFRVFVLSLVVTTVLSPSINIQNRSGSILVRKPKRAFQIEQSIDLKSGINIVDKDKNIFEPLDDLSKRRALIEERLEMRRRNKSGRSNRKRHGLTRRRRQKESVFSVQDLQDRGEKFKSFDWGEICLAYMDFPEKIDEYLIDLRGIDSDLTKMLRFRLALQSFFEEVGVDPEKGIGILNRVLLMMKNGDLSDNLKESIFDIYNVMKKVKKPKNRQKKKLENISRKLNFVAISKLYSKRLSQEEKIIIDQLYQFSKFILQAMMDSEGLASPWDEILDLVFLKIKDSVSNKKKVSIYGVTISVVAILALLFKHYYFNGNRNNRDVDPLAPGLRRGNTGDVPVVNPGKVPVGNPGGSTESDDEVLLGGVNYPINLNPAVGGNTDDDYPGIGVYESSDSDDDPFIDLPFVPRAPQESRIDRFLKEEAASGWRVKTCYPVAERCLRLTEERLDREVNYGN